MSHHHSHEPRLLLIEKVLLLKALDIFANTPETVLTEVAGIMQETDVEQGTVIFRTGDIGNCMYVIHKGEIRIEKDAHQLAILKENEIFGELSLLDTDSRSADAIAHTDTMLLRMDQEPFYELMENRIEVARGVIKTLCRRLREQNARAIQLAAKSGA